MNQPAVSTKTRVEPGQGPLDAVVIAADRLTDDGTRGVGDKLTRPRRHEARTITRRQPGAPVGTDPQGSRCYNGSNINACASLITDPGPASLGSMPVSVVTSTQDRPVLDPQTIGHRLGHHPPRRGVAWASPHSDPSFRPARRIGRAGSEEGGMIASVVIALVAIGLVATLGLSGAAHEVVVLGRAGWHAIAGWFSAHRPALGTGGGG